MVTSFTSQPFPTAAPQGRFDGPSAFRDAVREALCAAAREGWREITLCDGDFRDWPLGEREVVEWLHQWIASGPGRKCTLLAADFSQMRLQHARFVLWRQRWDHRLECRQLLVREPSQVPSVFWSPHWVMHRVDTERSRGVAAVDAQQCLAWRERLAEWITARSRPGFPASILGL